MDKIKEDFSDEMIPYVEFAENANERTPCILVLDCSGSMRGEPIKQLNSGLEALEKELKEDIDASSRVQLLVIKAFGKDDAEVSADWVDAMNFTAPVMEASGLSPIGKAMKLALQKIEDQKGLYDCCGVSSKRPWIFLISDGEPTDYGWEQAAEECRIAQQNKKVVVHAVGTQGANLLSDMGLGGEFDYPKSIKTLETGLWAQSFGKTVFWACRRNFRSIRYAPASYPKLFDPENLPW